MINELLDYYRSMFHTVKKDQILKSLDHIMKSMNDETIPALESISKSKSLKVIADSNILNTINNSAKLKARTNADTILKLKSFFDNISKNEKNLVKLIKDNISETVTDKTATAREVAIMKMVSDIGAANKYVMDLNYMILLSDSETQYPKSKFVNVRSSITNFIAVVRAYNDNFSKVIDKVSKISNTVVNDGKDKPSMLDAIIAKAGAVLPLPRTSAFNNNPVYHIRMWLVDREIEKYESLKDNRKLIELKLLDLKLEEAQESDPKLKQQIEFYENKLSKIEYEIKEIEEDD